MRQFTHDHNIVRSGVFTGRGPCPPTCLITKASAEPQVPNHFSGNSRVGSAFRWAFLENSTRQRCTDLSVSGNTSNEPLLVQNCCIFGSSEWSFKTPRPSQFKLEPLRGAPKHQHVLVPPGDSSGCLWTNDYSSLLVSQPWLLMRITCRKLWR